MTPLHISTAQIKDQRVRINGASLPFGCIPLIIDDVVSEWEAMTKWTPQYLKEACGSHEVSCFIAHEANATFLQQTNATKTLPFSSFVDVVFNNTMSDDHQCYLRVGSEHPVFQALSSDFIIPEFIEGYNAPATGIWMGEQGNVTPFHHDWWHSFLAQVRGKKHFTLVSFLEGETLQTNWPPEARYDLKPAPVIDGTGSSSYTQQLTTCYEGILEPGQMLYIPPYWYHQVKTLDNGNISLPIRFDTTLSPHIPLLQLSQNSVLRAYTNEQVDDCEELVEGLKVNRKLFAKREKEFVEAFVKTRCPETSAESIQKKLEDPPSWCLKL